MRDYDACLASVGQVKLQVPEIKNASAENTMPRALALSPAEQIQKQSTAREIQIETPANILKQTLRRRINEDCTQ